MKKIPVNRLFIILTPTRILALGFALIILVGAGLLTTSAATRSGVRTPFLDALFTATSATCVTGLVVYDTYSYWAPFGQTVILLLIQIGGLGFMTMATLFSFAMRKQITLKQRLVTAESFNQGDIQGIINLTRHVIFGTLLLEVAGALLLSIQFCRDFGLVDGVIKGVFHSVSAFCNAGFDLMGERDAFSSLVSYHSNFIVMYTVMVLIVIGGIGFSVWGDVLFRQRTKKGFSLHTKIVFTVTVMLLVAGTLGFFIFEYANDKTLGGMNLWDKFTNALFQSVTTRTAGFNAVDQKGLTDQSKLLSIILMIIGGSPGSTAGGIKTTTFGVLLIAILAVMRGYSDVNIFSRRLSGTLILRCLFILMMALGIVVFGTMLICVFEDFDFLDILFEVSSAFGTVGISTGITPHLCGASKVILIITMFLGRVGVLTIGWALALKSNNQRPSKIKYPEGKVSVG